MKKYIVLFLIFTSLLGCKSVHNAQTNTKNLSLEKSLLWEIRVPGVKKPSYLYGTIHMIPAKDFFLPKGTLAAIDRCDDMYFEIDMADMNDLSSMMKMLPKMFMKENKTLKDIMSQDDYKLVRAHFDNLGMPMFLLERVKPMFLSAFAMSDLNPEDMQNGNTKAYETELYKISKANKMKSGGLETIEFQMSVFDSIPYTDQAQMLVESIKNTDAGDAEYQKMIDLYRAQDIEGMIDFMTTDTNELSNHDDILLKQRNITWIPQIIKQSKKRPTFYAVGAGHLGGKNGVINLLRREGVIVKAVR